MIDLVRVEESGWVRGAFVGDDPDLGPPRELAPCPDGLRYEPVRRPFVWAPPTPHHDARWLPGGEVEWVDRGELEQHRAEAIDAIDAAGEALRLAVISKMTQTKEYERAEQHAREYRAAGYPEGPDVVVPAGVASWAAAKWREGWTARQAADDILATAERWYGVLDQIRAVRLMKKEDVRHAGTSDEIAAISSAMAGEMQTMAQGLGLTLT